ncbi:fatty-acyl-CoA synthase [Paenalcaligenes hominis]|uniref:Fatty-acyl-CoA synthase n=3 Tax=Paenalcaligenes hominis TaxID=643674 RepID=A0ABX0WSB7_9BURK|nr:AMP-binding protein [Paenalcaligenes hominis]NJB65646.1 fatty-acyl-CoA synthase [Paenalcaligenes hominis]GGE64157.1 AMP-binding protein [Paenalcaligenes hominis]
MSRKSYVRGSTEVALTHETIGDYFDRVVKTHANHDALVSCAETIHWTWQELHTQVEQAAAGLLAIGLEPGDRLAIWANTSSTWLVTQLACAKTGIILVNINPSARPSELTEQLNAVQAKGLVFQTQFKSSHYTEMLQALLPELAHHHASELHAQAIPSLRYLIQIEDPAPSGMLSFAQLKAKGTQLNPERLAQAQSQIQAHDPCNIQFSSALGTFAAPVTLTHFNLLNNGFFIGQQMQYTPNDRVCIPVPLFHCFGMVMGNMACIAHGATMIYPDEAFDPARVLAAIQSQRCTALYGVPAMFLSLLDHPQRATTDVSSLRTGIMAGAPCPIDVMQRVTTELHMPEVLIGYGMTESSPISFMTARSDPLQLRVSTVGQVQPHIEAQLLDEHDDIVPIGTVGQLCVRGYHVMAGYWQRDDLTQQVIKDGWLYTGDLAQFDDQGYCQIVGNIKDMIIRGGENIYLAEVHSFLRHHPAIDELILFGVPDQRMGQELCVAVRLQDGHSLDADRLRQYCQGQIAHYKIPRYVLCYTDFPSAEHQSTKELLVADAIIKLGL